MDDDVTLVPDIPIQYKAMMDDCVSMIMDIATEIMAVVEELGLDNFKCMDGVYAVSIVRMDDMTEEDDDGSNSSTQD